MVAKQHALRIHSKHFKRKEIAMTDTQKEKLLTILKSWYDTPFVPSLHGKALRKRFADCVSFPIAVYTELGIITEQMKLPEYNSKFCGSYAFEQLLGGIRSLGAQEVWAKNPLVRFSDYVPRLEVGDLIVCSIGAGCHHLCIYAGDSWVVDCYPPAVRQRSVNLKLIHKTSRYVFRFTN